MLVSERNTRVVLLGLHRIAKRIGTAQDSEALCTALADGMADELTLPDVVVYRRCANPNQFAQAAAAGGKACVGGGVLAPLTITATEGIVGYAIQQARSVRVHNTQHYARYIIDDAPRLAELSVPICYDGETLGVIDAEHANAGFFEPLHELSFMLAAELAAPKLAELMARERQRSRSTRQSDCAASGCESVPVQLRSVSYGSMDAAQFGAAIEHALRHIAAPQQLLNSSLHRCALLLLQTQSANPVIAVRQMLADTVESLIRDARTAVLGRSLKSAYFDAPESRALLASRLHVGESTLRRRLKLARDTLIATLWAVELAARGDSIVIGGERNWSGD